MLRAPAPRDEAELRKRAAVLAGKPLAEVARWLAGEVATGLHAKGKVGELVEAALGATAGNASTPDFPALGVELKTIPVDARGRPHESTFVCALALADAEHATWETSRARAKLAHVLWVPIVDDASGDPEARAIGRPLFWRPSAEQERVLRDDFDELVGRIGAGGIEGLTARAGRWLQVRPKAASGRVRTLGRGPDGDWIATVPRGLYLRARFTGALLADPAALPP